MKDAHSEGRDAVFVWSSGDIRSFPEKARVRRGPPRRRTTLQSNPVDTRRYPRLDLKFPILYRVVGEDVSDAPAAVRPFLMAKSRDVSPIGLCLTLEDPLPLGTLMALTLYAPDPNEKFEALARVVWVRPTEEEARHLIGLQFVVVDGARVREERHVKVEAIIQRLETP